MKRNIERLTFFILGALFVVVGYFIGEFNPKVNAQEDIKVFDQIVCKSLVVTSGTPENPGAAAIVMSGDLNGATLVLIDKGTRPIQEIGEIEKRSRIELNFNNIAGERFARMSLINSAITGGNVTLAAGESIGSVILKTANRPQLTDGLLISVGSAVSLIMNENTIVSSEGH